MSNIIDDIESKRNEIYNESGKNMFFKKQQKNDIAQQISNQFDINQLLHLTCYSKDHQIIVDYPVLKLYAHPDNYKQIIHYIMNIYRQKLNQKIDFHFNINGFTVTSAERYKDLIKMYFDVTQNAEFDVTQMTNKIYVYYTPSIITQLTQMLQTFISDEIKERVIYISKKDSEAKWASITQSIKEQ